MRPNIKDDSTSANPFTRRTFLHLAIASVTVAPACSGAGGSSPETFGDVSAGKSADVAIGSLAAIPGAPACIGRDAKGIYAMTVTCTHAGCDMISQGVVAPTGIECSCHGSVFDAIGNVTRGPAKDPLQHFAVTVDAAGNLTVHGGQPVDASERLPAP